MMNNTITQITSVLAALERARPFSAQAQSKAIDGALDTMTAIKANLEQSTEPRDLAVWFRWEMAEGTFLKSNYSKENRLDAAIQFVELVVGAVQTGMIPGSIGSSLISGLRINAEGVDPTGNLLVPEDLDKQLLEAAQGNRVEEVLSLIERGANVLAKDSAGSTWLHGAAENGHTECALAVLDRLSPADQRRLHFEKNNSGSTWLHGAAENGHTECALAVLNRLSPADQRRLHFEKNNSDSTWLHVEAYNGDTECALAVLDRLSPADQRQLLLQKSSRGETAANVARECGQRKMVQALEKLSL